MIVRYVRFKDSDWIGLFVAKDMEMLFELIEEFGDPYDTEIRIARAGGIAVSAEDDDFQISESLDDVIEEPAGWEAPPWSENFYA